MATNLDSELEDALSKTEGAELRPVAKAVEPEKPARKRSKKGNIALLVALLAMAAGVMVLFLVGFKEASIYAMKADEVVAKAETLKGKRLRVEGELVPKTLVKRDSPCEYRFRMQNGGVELPVVYKKCDIPDTFRDRPEGGVMVTVEGQLAKDSTSFEATNVMAKCASKYDPKSHKMEGEANGPVGQNAP